MSGQFLNGTRLVAMCSFRQVSCAQDLCCRVLRNVICCDCSWFGIRTMWACVSFPTYVSETDFAVKLPLRSSKQESSTTSNRTSPVHALISTSSVVRDLPKTLEASPSLQENPGLKMSQAKDPDLGLRSFASSEKLFHVCLTWSSDKDMLTQALMLERAMRVPLFK